MTAWGFDFPIKVVATYRGPVGFSRKAGVFRWSGKVSTPIAYKNMVRHDKVCSYCLNSFEVLTADHIRPRTDGGTLEDNLTGACSACNTAKRSMPLLQFLIKIGGLKCDFSTRNGLPSKSTPDFVTTEWETDHSDSMAGFPALKFAFQSAFDGGSNDTQRNSQCHS